MSADSKNGLRARVEAIDKLVHEPARLLLMAHLYVVDQADFVFLLNQTGLTAGNVSSHMRKLLEAGYVDVEKAFVENRPQTSYNLTREGRRAFGSYRGNLAGILEMLPGG
jgi:predicted ArsR family transcriptional regulator